MSAAWVPCPECDEWWCRLHGQHTADCACPPIDELEFDPYEAGGPDADAIEAAEVLVTP